MKRMTSYFRVATVFLLGLSGEAIGQVAPETPVTIPSFHDDSWHVNISPYLWMAGMDGTVSVKGHTVKVEHSFSDIFENLKFGVMGLTEMRRGRVGILMDLMWIRLVTSQPSQLRDSRRG